MLTLGGLTRTVQFLSVFKILAQLSEEVCLGCVFLVLLAVVVLSGHAGVVEPGLAHLAVAM